MDKQTYAKSVTALPDAKAKKKKADTSRSENLSGQNLKKAHIFKKYILKKATEPISCFLTNECHDKLTKTKKKMAHRQAALTCIQWERNNMAD